MQLLKEKKWTALCVLVLAIAAVIVALVLLSRPAEDSVPEAAETAATAALTASPAPTIAPTPSPTPPPVITPPAQSAASGSDVILSHVPPASDSNLGGELPEAPEPE